MKSKTTLSLAAIGILMMSTGILNLHANADTDTAPSVQHTEGASEVSLGSSYRGQGISNIGQKYDSSTKKYVLIFTVNVGGNKDFLGRDTPATINSINLNTMWSQSGGEGTYQVTSESDTPFSGLLVVVDSANNQYTYMIPTAPNISTPVINASDVSLKVGDKFDPMSGVTASDEIDGDITNKVSVKSNDVDTSKPGTYHVTYTVTNSSGVSVDKTITVTVKASTTVTSFKRVYWQKYGYVYEGQVKNSDWDMSTASNLKEVINVVDASGKTVQQVSATPTDWYTKGTYNGFQFILNNDLLAGLESGNYSFQIQVTTKGNSYEAVPLTITAGLGSGLYHDTYTDLEETVVKSKEISPLVENNKPEIKIENVSSSTQIKQVNKYWNDKIQLVFDGYISLSSGQSYTGVTRGLEIKDKSGKVVYEKNELKNIDTSWGESMGVAKEATFQAIVPYEYSNQSKYSYTISVKDSNGKEIATQVLK
ncbi:DUF5011 domain-containing protein [Lactococcus lactis]|uniref:DUF5011 domain-containing protein n=1 Tax=Lactococcus lactis TaxID=1358 RepID=A0A9X4NVB4_9LACT|nr:immunoglobulin-like domain-containing protein [Lactococcus lactis]MDG4984976.1 DUF5011 domain-containing protein [Lactococcus lactis]